MNEKVNGWPVIAYYLELRRKNQTELARALQLSPPAVTQIKKGESLLNAEQLARIVRFLDIGADDIARLYTDIVNARLVSPDASGHEPQFEVRLHCNSSFDANAAASSDPDRVFPFELLKGYEPAIETLADFIFRRTRFRPEGRLHLIAQSADDPEIVPGTRITVRFGIPRSGELVLAALRDMPPRIRRYRLGEGIITLDSECMAGSDFIWRVGADPGYVRWMYPIDELHLKFGK